MALIKWRENDTEYMLATGVVYGLKFNKTRNDKQYASFSIAYGYTHDEFNKPINLYVSCKAWASLAEYIKSLDDGVHKIRVLVCGKLQTNEYQGTTREEILCDFIIGQPIADTAVKREEERRKKEDDSWDDINF